MNTRDRKSMSLLKNLFDEFHSLPKPIRFELQHGKLEKLIDQVPTVLKMYKEDVGKEISLGVVVSGINERFGVTSEGVIL